MCCDLVPDMHLVEMQRSGGCRLWCILFLIVCLTSVSLVDIIASHQPPRQASNWDYQVIISQATSNGFAACWYYSMKNAEDTPCTWTNPVELENGDKYMGVKWYLPATPGGSTCAPCLDGMVCDGLNFFKGICTPLQVNTHSHIMYVAH